MPSIARTDRPRPRLAEVLDGRLRVVAVVGRDRRVASVVTASAGDRALLLVDPALAAAPGAPLSWQPHPSDRPVGPSNAEVLVLTGRSTGEVWHGAQWRQARTVAWSLSARPSTLLAAAGTAKQLLLRRAGAPRVTRYAGRWFCVLDTRARSRPRPRRYFSPVLGVDGFLGALTDAGVRYVVLRWFETLPYVAPGEDVDLLVADEDLPTVQALLDRWPGTLPCDLYTVSGLPGTEFAGAMAYYPPTLAEQVLAGRQRWRGRYGVPNPEDAFLSLAYHAVYHKGEESGLPRSATEPATVRDPEHDYQAVLSERADALGISVDVTLEGLDELLDKRGWRPPSDMLARLSVRNSWLRARLAAARTETREDSPGLAVFFVRERAVERGLADRIVAELAADGFSVLAVRPLAEADRDRVRRVVRGGNWGRGPWPVSGGEPALAVVALDLVPQPPTAAMLARWPALANARLLVKERLRAWANAGVPPDEHANVLHGSDNGPEAVHYLRVALPEEADTLLADAQRHRQAFATAEFDVLADLTKHGRRAKLELVDVGGRLGVKKTFKPGCERFLERERLAAERFAPRDPHFLPLLAAGENYLVWPYVQDTLRFSLTSSRLLPVPVAREAMAALRFVHDQGYAFVDFAPGNLLVDATGRVYVIDAEFLQPCANPPAEFEASYDIAGGPGDGFADLPKTGGGASGYDQRWRPYTGLSLDDLLHAPGWRQELLRVEHRLREGWPRSGRRRASRSYRRLRHSVRRMRSTRLGRAARRLLA